MPACRPRSGRPSPRTARSGGGPRPPGRTARADARVRPAPRAGRARRPASTSRRRRLARARAAAWPAAGRSSARDATAARRSAGGSPAYDRLAPGSGAYLRTSTSTSASMWAARAAASAGPGACSCDRVDADAALPPRHAQEAAVVHGLEQVCRGGRRAAPVVRDPAVGEVRIHVARVHVRRARARTPAAPAPSCRRPVGQCAMPARGCISANTAARHEAVVDEGVFLDAERRVAAFEVAGAVALDAVAQRQVLRARRGADRVGLHEAERVDGAFRAWSAGRGWSRRHSVAGRPGTQT